MGGESLNRILLYSAAGYLARPNAMTKNQLTEITLVQIGTVAQQTLKSLQRGSWNRSEPTVMSHRAEEK